MFSEMVVEVEDKSFYADWLEKRTGKPRGFWGEFSLAELQKIYEREVRKGDSGTGVFERARGGERL